MKAATKDVNNKKAQKRIDQVLLQGGNKIECVHPKILAGA